ncbi:SRPBCC family protein [uncultured Algibacter sp.]|uniref:SRPBCC family protein n=1 Tax=uncultured Algibacter sp. TaxID=298659 RepID=UPI002601C1F1|nr:SRPBCC family protein [uncultured Algibacter sp.]
MPLTEYQTVVNADLKTCFDLARNIEFHSKSLKRHNIIPIEGRTTGLIKCGEIVTFESKHFGFVRHVTLKITAYDAPNYFIVEMTSGFFKSFKHEYIFHEGEDGTIVINRFYFELPYGVLGKLVNVLVLKKYMRKLLSLRAKALKDRAEKNT